MPGIGLNPSGCCCAPGGNVVVTVVGCNSTPVPGVSVAVSTGGVLKATGTTDASGKVTFTLDAYTNYTCVMTPVTAVRGYKATNGSFNTSLTGWTGSLTIAVDDPYVCCSLVNYPVPRSLNATFGDGAYVLATGGPSPIWQRNGSTNADVTPVRYTDPVTGSVVCNGKRPYQFTASLACNPGGFTLTLAWYENNYDPPCFDYPTYSAASGFGRAGYLVQGGAVPSSSPPFVLVGSISGTAGNIGEPTHTSSFTISE